MPQDSEDFADVIEKAQKIGNSKDLGSLFNVQNGPGRVAFEPRGNRAGPDQDFEAHSEVFALPADRDAYEDVMNQVLRGEAIMRYEDRTFTKEGDLVIDPFLGSGTTALACLKLNRNFIGIEKNHDYCEIARKRIQPWLEQRRLT